MIKVTLKGGDVREYEAGTTAGEIAKSLRAGLYKADCAVSVDGEVRDLRTPHAGDCALDILTFDDEAGRRAFNHPA